MLIISLATSGTIITLNIHKKGDDGIPVPCLIQKIFFDWIAFLLLIKIKADRTLTKSVNEKLIELNESNKNKNNQTTDAKATKQEKLISALFNKNNIEVTKIEFDYINSNELGLNIDIDLDEKDSLALNYSPSRSISEKSFEKISYIMSKMSKENVLKHEINEYKAEIKSQWAHLAKVIDILFFYVFILATSLMIFIIGIQLPEIRFY